MASKAMATTTILISFNLLFFTMVSSTYCPPPSPPPPKNCSPPPPPKGHHHHHHHHDHDHHHPSCPKDTLKLGVCADVLNGLTNVVVGTPPKSPCCPLISGLVDLEAALCLCTALKANVLGINLNVPVSLSLLLNYCGKKVPYGFQCA